MSCNYKHCVGGEKGYLFHKEIRSYFEKLREDVFEKYVKSPLDNKLGIIKTFTEEQIQIHKDCERWHRAVGDADHLD